MFSKKMGSFSKCLEPQKVVSQTQVAKGESMGRARPFSAIGTARPLHTKSTALPCILD